MRGEDEAGRNTQTGAGTGVCSLQYTCHNCNVIASPPLLHPLPPPPSVRSYSSLLDMPPHLNFLSDSFDAAAALAHANLLILVSRVRPLDSFCKAVCAVSEPYA